VDIKEELATEALRIVNGSRRTAYGTPERNFERIAVLWQVYLALRLDNSPNGNIFPLEPRDVAAMMRLMKEARLIETPDHRDSFLDIVGYALCGAEVSGVRSILDDLDARIAELDAEEADDAQQLASFGGIALGDTVRVKGGTAVLGVVSAIHMHPANTPTVSIQVPGGGSTWAYFSEIDKVPTPSDTPAAQSWTDPEHEDGA
jgi:hypothetical protein